MCAFQCDSCFHKLVCGGDPNLMPVNKPCALYANVKNFTDVQQLKAEIAAIVHNLDMVSHSSNFKYVYESSLERMRQLSAV